VGWLLLTCWSHISESILHAYKYTRNLTKHQDTHYSHKTTRRYINSLLMETKRSLFNLIHLDGRRWPCLPLKPRADTRRLIRSLSRFKGPIAFPYSVRKTSAEVFVISFRGIAPLPSSRCLTLTNMAELWWFPRCFWPLFLSRMKIDIVSVTTPLLLNHLSPKNSKFYLK